MHSQTERSTCIWATGKIEQWYSMVGLDLSRPFTSITLPSTVGASGSPVQRTSTRRNLEFVQWVSDAQAPKRIPERMICKCEVHGNVNFDLSPATSSAPPNLPRFVHSPFCSHTLLLTLTHNTLIAAATIGFLFRISTASISR